MSDDVDIEQIERDLAEIGWTLVHVRSEDEPWRAERRAGGPLRSEASMTARGLLRACREREEQLDRQGEARPVSIHTGVLGTGNHDDHNQED